MFVYKTMECTNILSEDEQKQENFILPLPEDIVKDSARGEVQVIG